MTSDRYERGCGPETVPHLVLRCERYTDKRHLLQLPGVRDGPTLRMALCRKDYVAKIVNWLSTTGRLQEYRLAKQLEEEAEEEELRGRNPIPPLPA